MSYLKKISDDIFASHVIDTMGDQMFLMNSSCSIDVANCVPCVLPENSQVDQI